MERAQLQELRRLITDLPGAARQELPDGAGKAGILEQLDALAAAFARRGVVELAQQGGHA